MVKKFLLGVTLVFESLGSAQCDLLTKIRDLYRLDIVNSVLRLISNTINNEATYVKNALDLRDQRTFSVKVEKLCCTLIFLPDIY